MHTCVLSHVQLFGIPRIVANKTPLSMEFAKQEYWSGLPFPTPEDLPNPGIEPVSLEPPALAGGFFTIVPSGKPLSLKFLKMHCFVTSMCKFLRCLGLDSISSSCDFV